MLKKRMPLDVFHALIYEYGKEYCTAEGWSGSGVGLQQEHPQAHRNKVFPLVRIMVEPISRAKDDVGLRISLKRLVEEKAKRKRIHDLIFLWSGFAGAQSGYRREATEDGGRRRRGR